MDEVRYREAEVRLWDSYGLVPAELQLDLDRTGTTIRAVEVGSGPPVVFVHGGSNAGASWATLVAGLDGFRSVVIDRPGCGLSPPLGTRFDDVGRLAAFGDDLVADVLDALGLDTAHLVATSFGGYFALRTAAAHPRRLGQTVELGYPIGAPMAPPPAVMRLSAVPGLGLLMASMPTPKAAVRPMLRQIGLGHALDTGTFGDTEVDWFHALLRHTSTMANELRAGPKILTPLRGMNPDILLSDQVLSQISTPLLFLWGEQDPFGGTDTAEALVARIPGAELQMVPDAGHAVWMDDPGGMADAVRAFLTR